MYVSRPTFGYCNIHMIVMFGHYNNLCTKEVSDKTLQRTSTST